MSRHRLLLLLLPGLLAVGCDNVGRAFDPDVNPNDPGSETGESAVQVVPEGGEVREGRPTVRAAYPEGAGWPRTVPIVVEFSESVNEVSLLPTTPGGLDGRIGVRLAGTTQLLPAQYDFLAEGRLLVIRPVNGLPEDPSAIYEVVLFPEARDTDGVRFQVTDGERLLTDFQVNQDESITDGSIVALFPRDNYRDHLRTSDFFVIFDRPANDGTLEDNVTLNPVGGAPIDVAVELPLDSAAGEDPRVVQLIPDAPLAASTRYEFTVTELITFGQDGNLDFNGRTPFSVFDTVAPSPPTSVELAGTAAGFENKINIALLPTVMVEVATPGDTLAGDLVVARIYGGDADTEPTFDEAFVERTATAPAAGAQTVAIDFTGQLGSLGAPALDDGAITFAAQIRRGGQSSGFVHHDPTTDPAFDITRPTLTRAGPPGEGTDVYVDTEHLTYYGQASEPLAAASLSDGTSTAAMFASDDDGNFLMLPVRLGRLTGPVMYNVSLTDLAGNETTDVPMGMIRQRGQVTGALAGTLTVEAYDEATLRPIEGATVIVDPVGSGPMAPMMTGTDGRYSVATAAAAHTITIVRAGYDLVTIYETQAALVSLPLRPTADAGSQATLSGVVAFNQAAGTTGLVSTSGAFDTPEGVRTTNAAPTEIPAIPVLPNRPQVVTGFASTFEPTATPTYTFQGAQILGPALTTSTAPVAPIEPGADGTVQLVLPPAVQPYGALPAAYTFNLVAATGLDTANLVADNPLSRVTTTLRGFTGQVAVGVGVPTLTAGTSYSVDANYALPLLAGFGELLFELPLTFPLPVTYRAWLMVQAEDTSGRLARARAALEPTSGLTVPLANFIPIPTITAQSAPNSRDVVFVDGITPLMDVVLGYHDITATDASGRRWLVIVPDRDATGTDTMTFPALGAVVGLEAGAWNVVAEARILFASESMTATDDLLLTDRTRMEANYSRSAPVTFTIQ